MIVQYNTVQKIYFVLLSSNKQNKIMNNSFIHLFF